MLREAIAQNRRLWRAIIALLLKEHFAQKKISVDINGRAFLLSQLRQPFFFFRLSRQKKNKYLLFTFSDDGRLFFFFFLFFFVLFLFLQVSSNLFPALLLKLGCFSIIFVISPQIENKQMLSFFSFCLVSFIHFAGVFFCLHLMKTYISYIDKKLPTAFIAFEQNAEKKTPQNLPAEQIASFMFFKYGDRKEYNSSMRHFSQLLSE